MSCTEWTSREGRDMKLLHAFGGLLLLLAVAGVEGGGFTCLEGLLVGMAGGAMMLSTMKRTGWYQ